MDKIKKMALTLLVFAIGLGIMTVNAEQGIVGVKVGDWAVYSCDLWAGTSHLNETGKVEVTSIVNTTIYYSLTWDPPVSDTNNTQLNLMFSNTGYVDVLTGAYGGSYAGYFIAVNGSGAALGGATYSMSRTVLMQYLGQTFEITHLTASGNDIQENLYWIKSTGVLTELELSSSGLSLTMHITSASAIPEFPVSSLLVLTFVVATLSSAIVLHRKKYATRTPKPTTELAQYCIS